MESQCLFVVLMHALTAPFALKSWFGAGIFFFLVNDSFRVFLVLIIFFFVVKGAFDHSKL